MPLQKSAWQRRERREYQLLPPALLYGVGRSARSVRRPCGLDEETRTLTALSAIGHDLLMVSTVTLVSLVHLQVAEQLKQCARGAAARPSTLFYFPRFSGAW